MDREIDILAERERLYSRLATIPGVRPMPSIGAWILLRVEHPSDLARKLNRRIVPGLASVPRHVDGAVRIPVKDPKANELLFNTVLDVMAGRNPHLFAAEVAAEPN